MTTITVATPASSLTCSLVRKGSIGASSSSVLGLPSMARRGGKVMCSAEKPSKKGASAGISAASLMAAAATIASPALALVDNRMSTEGTGLVFGLSNNLLGWILLGVFGLIWTLYFTYTSTLEEDEESGLSL